MVHGVVVAAHACTQTTPKTSRLWTHIAIYCRRGVGSNNANPRLEATRGTCCVVTVQQQRVLGLFVSPSKRLPSPQKTLVETKSIKRERQGTPVSPSKPSQFVTKHYYTRAKATNVHRSFNAATRKRPGDSAGPRPSPLKRFKCFIGNGLEIPRGWWRVT